jgi:signal transduction histidine kinase
VIATASIVDALLLGSEGSGAGVATFEVRTSLGLTIPGFVPGPIGVVYTTMSFVLFVATLGVLLAFIREPKQRLYRRQNQLLLFSASGPAFVEIVLRSVSIPFEATPLISLPTGLAVLTAVFRYGIFNLSPVTREQIVQDLDAGTLTYDNRGRIIDANPIARSVLELPDQLTGTDVEPKLATSPLDIEPDDGPIRNCIDGHEFAVDGEEGTRYFTVKKSTIERYDGEALAFTLLFSEITEQRRREQELDVLKQVFSRVLRHNLRTDMNVIESTATELVERTDGRDAELAERIATSSSVLVDISEKARLIETVVERPSERTTIDLVATVEEVIERMESEYHDATFDVDLPPELCVVAHPALDVAIRNAVENALEHATDEAVSVSVAASVEGGQCTLDIVDDGPGIPEDELAPLDERSETPLNHASGVGLWLIHWAITHSDGTVTFEGSPDGTTVTMVLDVEKWTARPETDPTALESTLLVIHPSHG